MKNVALVALVGLLSVTASGCTAWRSRERGDTAAWVASAERLKGSASPGIPQKTWYDILPAGVYEVVMLWHESYDTSGDPHDLIQSRGPALEDGKTYIHVGDDHRVSLLADDGISVGQASVGIEETWLVIEKDSPFLLLPGKVRYVLSFDNGVWWGRRLHTLWNVLRRQDIRLKQVH